MPAATAHDTPAFPTREDAAFMERAVEAVTGLRLFAGLPSSLRRQLPHMMTFRGFAAGELIFSPDAPADKIWFVCAGNVRLWRHHGERELTTALLDSGESLGESSILGSNPSDGYAQAAGPVILASLDPEQMLLLMQRYPQVAIHLAHVLHQRLDDAQAMAERIALWSLPRRLARLLLDLDSQYGHPTLDGRRVINRTLTQREVGTMIGVSREVVSRQYCQWQREQLVTSRGGRMVLVDQPALLQIAGNEHAMA